MNIKIGDRVKYFAEHNDPKQSGWEYGTVYHIGEKTLAFETDDDHVWCVKIEDAQLV